MIHWDKPRKGPSKLQSIPANAYNRGEITEPCYPESPNETAAVFWTHQNLADFRENPNHLRDQQVPKKNSRFWIYPWNWNLPKGCPWILCLQENVSKCPFLSEFFLTFHGGSCDTWSVLWFRTRFQNPDNQPADSTITPNKKVEQSWFCSCRSNHYGWRDVCSPQLDAKSLRFVQPIIQEFVKYRFIFSELPHWIVLFSGFLQPFIPLFCLAALHNPRNPEFEKQFAWYGWWKKSGIHQLRLVVYPTIYKVLYIPGGCLGFLPSTVVMREMLTISINPKKIRSGTTSSTC